MEEKKNRRREGRGNLARGQREVEERGERDGRYREEGVGGRERERDG